LAGNLPDRARLMMIVAVLVIILIALAAISVIEYNQIQHLESNSSTTSVASSSTGMFLIFQQKDPCGYLDAPWEVTVSNQTWTKTSVQPPGAIVPMNGTIENQGYNSSLSIISFYLSQGIYNYVVQPYHAAGFANASATVTMRNSDVHFQFNGGCPP
jgi:hypothetical protein